MKLITGPKWGTLWSHLVKREIVQSPQIVWPTWNYCEDLALVFQYIALSRNIDYVNSSFYNYRYNTLSICNAIEREKKIVNISGAINAILTELEKKWVYIINFFHIAAQKFLRLGLECFLLLTMITRHVNCGVVLMMD